jgi:hypothetical protein
MSQAHKEALAVGREEGRAVRRYLEALDAHKPKRGRKRNPESIQKRLDEIDEKLQSSDALSRVHLVQERMDLESELQSKDAQIDLGALEEQFIKAAKNYSQRHHLCGVAGSGSRRRSAAASRYPARGRRIAAQS